MAKKRERNVNIERNINVFHKKYMIGTLILDG